jgi:hypothetical protein
MTKMLTMKRFKHEVINRGAAEACLPVNLSDEWLELLIDELSFFDNINVSGFTKNIPNCTIAAISKILYYRQISFSDYDFASEFIRTIIDYRVELILEKFNRNLEIKTGSASIDTIFTDREVIINFNNTTSRNVSFRNIIMKANIEQLCDS